MGNFTGSYHWKTLADFVTRIFSANSQPNQVALGNAAVPNKAMPGDICVRTDLDNQWYIMTANSNPSVIGDWSAIVPWEAVLIPINAITQFPGTTTIQGVLTNALSGATGGAGNPFDIVTDAGHGIGAGVLAPAAGTVNAAARVIGTTGLQAGATASDHVITRINRTTVSLVGNGALAAHTSADETLAPVSGAIPASAHVIGMNPTAAMVAGCVLCPGRNNGAGSIVVRYINCTAAPIAVAADATFGVMWMLTVVI